MKTSTIFVSLLLGLSTFSLLYAAYPSVPVASSILIVETSPSTLVSVSTVELVSNSIYLLSTKTATVIGSSTRTSCACSGGEIVCITAPDGTVQCYERCYNIQCVCSCWTQLHMYSDVYTNRYNSYSPWTYSTTLTIRASTSNVLTTETRYTTRTIPPYEFVGMSPVKMVALFAILGALILLSLLRFAWFGRKMKGGKDLTASRITEKPDGTTPEPRT
jgi:hypothetical protein